MEPAYASTIHKAQGTTLGRAFVIERDIATFPESEGFNMRQALRYVALTRAESKVAVLK